MGSHADDAARSEPEYRRPIIVGTVIGIALFTIGVTGMGIAAGLDALDAFGIAIFCSFWGGVGFGAWFGAAYAVSRPEPTTVAPSALRPREEHVPHAA